ncbi:MAG: class I SAM-dependent methyltransferase [candidate division WOR-3 bacterium]
MNGIRNFYENVYHFEEDVNVGLDVNRLKNFFKNINIKKVNKCLDIGCGVGWALTYLSTMKNSSDTLYVGIDISVKALRLAKTHLKPSINVLVANGERLPFQDEYFDLVYSLGTIEHFKDPEQGLSEIVRVTKKTGQILLVVPNSYWLLNKVKIYMGTEQPQEMLATLGEWGRLLGKFKLRISRVRKDIGPRVFKNRNIIGILKRFLLKYTILLSTSFAYQFVVYCEKK